MTVLTRRQAIFASCAAVGVALVLASCGHGASSVSQSPGQPRGHVQRVRFKITVPTPGPTQSSDGVHHYYVSGGTTAAGVTVTPQGGAPFPTVYVSCTSASCSGSVSAPIGVDTFAVSLYGGDRISPDTLLSTGTTIATIQGGVTNEVDVTFDPVVSSIVLNVIPSTLPPGSPGSATVTINATDATGNTIVGPGTYVNSLGSPLTIDLTNKDTMRSGHHGHSTTLSQVQVTGPPPIGPTEITLTYNGDPNLATTKVNASTTVHINGTITPATLIVGASPSPTPTGCSVSATPQPVANFFLVPKSPGNPNATVGDSIASGPDGDLWSSDGSRRAFQLQVDGTIKSFDVPGAGAGSVISTMTAGPASGTTVWFADVGMRSIGRITVGSSPDITMLSVPDIEPPNQSLPVSVAPGPDGNMWFTDRGSDYLGSVAPLIGSFDEFPIPKNSNRFSQGVVVLPSGELWFVESGLSKLGMVQISSLQLGSVNAVTEIQAGSSVANEVQKISADPNGNVWFTEPQSDKIARVNVSAVPITVDEFSVPTAKAQPNGIAPGPDGAMWFTETKGKNLGRIPFDAAPGTSPTEFAFGLFAPGGLVTGPDCNVWVTDSTSPRARIGQIKF